MKSKCKFNFPMNSFFWSMSSLNEAEISKLLFTDCFQMFSDSILLIYIEWWKVFKKDEGEASSFFCHSSEVSRQIPQIPQSTIDRVYLQLARGRLYEEAETKTQERTKAFFPDREVRRCWQLLELLSQSDFFHVNGSVIVISSYLVTGLK